MRYFKQGFEKRAFIGGMLSGAAKFAVTNPLKTLGIASRVNEGVGIARKAGAAATTGVQNALPQPNSKFFRGGM